MDAAAPLRPLFGYLSLWVPVVGKGGCLEARSGVGPLAQGAPLTHPPKGVMGVRQAWVVAGPSVDFARGNAFVSLEGARNPSHFGLFELPVGR